MWTPKRIVLLAGCFIALFSGYLGYAYTAVGRIDGLPPLPEHLWPEPIDGPIDTPKIESRLEVLLKQAFGNNCDELKRAIRFALPAKNMVLAAENFQPAPDGRVCLSPVSVALFSKDRGDKRPVEINCIRADVAWLKFDRPVTNFSELNSRKIVEAELNGKIDITNNRRRPQRDQDLHVHIPVGPLYYREDTHRIWTPSFLTLTDHKSKPKPHLITGKGMEMELATEAPAGSPGPHGKQKETISGVKWIALLSAVDMHLYNGPGDNFLPGGPRSGQPAVSPSAPPARVVAKPIAGKSPAGGPALAAAGPARPDGRVAPNASPEVKKPERAHLHIRTPGKFRYDLFKDHDEARFDALEVPANQTSREPPQVICVRTNLDTLKNDQLSCQHLTLRLRRKDAGGNGTREAAGQADGADIETAHAVSRGPGRHVILTSDAEEVTATGNDFFYDARTRTTTLKGTPEAEVLYKDDTRLYATELIIQDARPAGPTPGPDQPAGRAYQKMWARGPGRIYMTSKAEKRTTQARWKTLLTSDKDGNQDLLTLTGDAYFLDEQAQQSLKADILKVWLDERDAKAQPASGVAGGRKPRHVEATGNVVARSRELNIHDTSRLIVWFKDVPAEMHLPPAGTPAGRIGNPSPPAGRVADPASQPVTPRQPRAMPRGPEQPGRVPGQAVSRSAGPVLAPPDKESPDRPFDLSARSVEAKVLRSPVRNSLDELWCEGSVHVRQEPARAEEKGTDVKGDTLKMTAGSDGGYFLVVTGDLAELQADKIYIVGPEVNIDQSSNKAWVYGDGAMKMESATNFQGEKLEKSVPLTVHWSKSMLFNGSSAEFAGSIQAEQEKARLACQHMHVFFDRTISLRQGNRSDQPAKVRKLVCDQEVRVEDLTYQGNKLVKYTLLRSPVLHMDSLEPDEDRPAKDGKPSAGNKVLASGPGLFKVWEPGSGQDLLNGDGPRPAERRTAARPAAPAKEPAKKADAEMKMTCVWFQRRMDANNQTGTAQFWERVRVLNLPCDRHDREIDLDVVLATDLPEGALYLSCDRLKVLDRPSNGKPNKQMESHGNVYAQGREFYARCGSLYYNQAKEQIILDGAGRGTATLYRVPYPGARAERAEGKKIIYWRASGKVDVIGANQIEGSSIPSGK